MKVFADIEQGSDEWHALRRGKPTASVAGDIITAAEGEISASSEKLIYELLAECGTQGDEQPQFESFAMALGKEREPAARDAFCAETGLSVTEVGFVLADDGVCGCSPDGLIPDASDRWLAGLEIKCPLKGTHAGYVLKGGLPAAYKQQIHWSMAVTRLSRWHFWSFHPQLKPLHVLVERDAYTVKVEAAMVQFVKEYRETYALAKTALFLPAELIDDRPSSATRPSGTECRKRPVPAAIGTCGNCEAEMAYNVPRLGPGGGYVHKSTGQLLCEQPAKNHG